MHEDQRHAEREEVKVDVSQDQSRLVFDRTQPFEIDAMRITIWVPFDGDSHVFRIQPSTFTFNPPRGVVSENELGFVYTDPNPAPERINAGFNSWLADVKQHLSWHERDLSKFNADLQSAARLTITARQQKLGTTDNLLASLNIPVRQAPIASTAAGSIRP